MLWIVSDDVLLVIPARLASSRLPRKVLLADTGKPLIRHVYERVRRTRGVARVVVATSDEPVARAVSAFGGEVERTSDRHACGTDRVAEVAARYPHSIVVNVQGDEPEMAPEVVEEIVALLRRDGEAPMATAATLLADPAELRRPERVKVVFDRKGRAMYFSRSPIPYVRDEGCGVPFWLHVGVYAYRRDFLMRWPSLPLGTAEQAEQLEQLRALEAGFALSVARVDYDGMKVDTPEEYRAFVERFRKELAVA
jgi:3-deoxy-manno-octulosonate cytidylyltransferase (CMP-KDO synthetase)